MENVTQYETAQPTAPDPPTPSELLRRLIVNATEAVNDDDQVYALDCLRAALDILNRYTAPTDQHGPTKFNFTE
jgi:hypothetical protein